MKNIFFSVIIPTYNSKKTILQCIESCLEQTYKNFEIIIVDDCSTDDTNIIIEDYLQKNKIEYVNLKKLQFNHGASYARNIGIQNARGKYIALLDSDDFFHYKKLEILHNIIIVNENIDLLGHDYYIYNEKIPCHVLSNFTIKKVSCKKLILKNFAVTPSIVFRKGIKVEFDESMRYAEDHDFFIRVCFNNYNLYYLDAKLVALNRPLLSRGGQSANNFKMRLGEIRMYLNLYKQSYAFIPLIPFLVMFSIVKHISKVLKGLLDEK